jgi:hypothetical protein
MIAIGRRAGGEEVERGLDDVAELVDVEYPV